MGAAEFTRAERAALCDLLLARGPDAATLCQGWTTTDLAAHMVVREARPDASLGIIFKPAQAWTKKVQDGAAARPYPELVAALRAGPPTLSLFRLPTADGALNVLEFFVHHEDVRRIGDWQPRALQPEDSDLLWSRLRGGARGLFRNSSVGVVLQRTDGDGGSMQAKAGEPTVRISGPAAELVMMAFGRREASLAQLSGTPEALAGFQDATLSV